jgi:hypothetical protein
MYLAGVSVRRVEDMRRLFKNNQRHQALIY